MLPVPAAFVDQAVYQYKQTCKRGKNFLDYLVNKKYIIEEKKLFKTIKYEVNVFGEINWKYGKVNNLLEFMLEQEYISPLDYQLLKFYDNSLHIDAAIEELYARKTADGLIPLNSKEFNFLRDISTFEEDPAVTKEQILNA